MAYEKQNKAQIEWDRKLGAFIKDEIEAKYGKRKLGVFKAQLEEKTSISSNTCESYLQGKVSVSAYNLSIIANELGVSVDHLINGANSKVSSPATVPVSSKAVTLDDIRDAFTTLYDAFYGGAIRQSFLGEIEKFTTFCVLTFDNSPCITEQLVKLTELYNTKGLFDSIGADMFYELVKRIFTPTKYKYNELTKNIEYIPSDSELEAVATLKPSMIDQLSETEEE